MCFLHLKVISDGMGGLGITDILVFRSYEFCFGLSGLNLGLGSRSIWQRLQVCKSLVLLLLCQSESDVVSCGPLPPRNGGEQFKRYAEFTFLGGGYDSGPRIAGNGISFAPFLDGSGLFADIFGEFRR